MSRGFTLIELAVVLAIIAVLAGILTPIVIGYVDEARITRAAADTRAIGTALFSYKRDTARFPIYADISDANIDSAAGDVLEGRGNGLTGRGGSRLEPFRAHQNRPG